MHTLFSALRLDSSQDTRVPLEKERLLTEGNHQ